MDDFVSVRSGAICACDGFEEPAVAVDGRLFATASGTSIDDWLVGSAAITPDTSRPVRLSTPRRVPVGVPRRVICGSLYHGLARRAGSRILSPGLRAYERPAHSCAPWDSEIALSDEAWLLDFEAEIAIITDKIGRGANRVEALRSVRAVGLVADMTYRRFVAEEVEKGFGFVISKAPLLWAPFVRSTEGLDAWRDGMLDAKVIITLNGEIFGELHTYRDFHADFGDLLSYVASTQALPVNTIATSGAVSATLFGHSTLAEKMGIPPKVPPYVFLQGIDKFSIECFSWSGDSLFGSISPTINVQANR